MSLTVESLLDKELTALEAFLRLLQDEHELLKLGPAERLHSLSEQKMQLVAALNALEAQREQLLGGAPGDTAAKRMEAWLKTKAGTSTIRSKWAKLLDQAREARRMHVLNAELVNSLLRRTGDAINILMQRQKEVSLYGSDGQATEVTGSRIVDSA